MIEQKRKKYQQIEKSEKSKFQMNQDEIERAAKNGQSQYLHLIPDMTIPNFASW